MYIEIAFGSTDFKVRESGCNIACVVAEDAALRGRLTECLETILNKAQEPPKSKKVQHSNAKNAVLFEAISLVIHHDRLVRSTVLSNSWFIRELWRCDLENENSFSANTN